jgi:hypothetical protein
MARTWTAPTKSAWTGTLSSIRTSAFLIGTAVCGKEEALELSALRFHELTTQAPFEVWLAIGEKAWRPRANYPPLRIVRFSGVALAAGVEEHVVEGVSVKVYCLLPLLPFLTQHQTGHRARFAMGHDVAQHPPGRDVILQP